MRPFKSNSTLHRAFALSAHLIAAIAVFAFFQPSASGQGGYDTSDTAQTDAPESDRRPDPYGQNERPHVDKEGNQKEEAPLPAVNDLEKWFSQYDEIRRKYENTPQERQYFESLASRQPGSGLSQDDQKFLLDMADRYAEAFNQMREVESCSETMHLHRSYAMFLCEQSNIFNDYIRVLGELDARDKRGRPLAPQMAERRRTVYGMERNNHLLDVRTRRAFDVSRNPYERQQPQE
jgi:hypothetical protein